MTIIFTLHLAGQLTHIRFIPCPIHCVLNIGKHRLLPTTPQKTRTSRQGLPSRAYSENRRICVSFRSARKGAFSRVAFLFFQSAFGRRACRVCFYTSRGFSQIRVENGRIYGGGCILRRAEMIEQMRRFSETSGALLCDVSEAFETRKVHCRIIV